MLFFFSLAFFLQFILLYPYFPPPYVHCKQLRIIGTKLSRCEFLFCSLFIYSSVLSSSLLLSFSLISLFYCLLFLRLSPSFLCSIVRFSSVLVSFFMSPLLAFSVLLSHLVILIFCFTSFSLRRIFRRTNTFGEWFVTIYEKERQIYIMKEDKRIN